MHVSALDTKFIVASDSVGCIPFMGICRKSALRALPETVYPSVGLLAALGPPGLAVVACYYGGKRRVLYNAAHGVLHNA